MALGYELCLKPVATCHGAFTAPGEVTWSSAHIFPAVVPMLLSWPASQPPFLYHIARHYPPLYICFPVCCRYLPFSAAAFGSSVGTPLITSICAPFFFLALTTQLVPYDG